MMGGRIAVVVILIASLVAAGGARLLAEDRRRAVEPELGGAAGQPARATLGQLNSFTLTLLLGGLRGPLVMVLWSSSETQRSYGEMEDFDTKIELIRLLQPQFASVHIYQIWNKAYNVSARMANLASRYAAILDAVEYARRVLAERPANIDIETQLGEIFNNKLGGAHESPYYTLRVQEETEADEPVVKITFPAARQQEFRRAALLQGISPRRLLVRRTEDPTQMVSAVRQSVARGLEQEFQGEDVTYRQMAARQVNTRGISGPIRLEPMLDSEGNLLPELVRPRRPAPPGVEPGTWLDGSPAQFLRQFAPYRRGLLPQALAYNHFMKAYILQNHAGQRHVNRSEAFIDANPGRALRDWALRSFDEGRMLEGESLGLTMQPPGISGELQAALERASADLPPDGQPLSRELFLEAMQQYEQSQRLSAAAAEWLERHIERYPSEQSTFNSPLRRLQDLQVLLAADLAYASLVAGTADDRQAARREAAQRYQDAFVRLVDFLVLFHAPLEVLPPGLTPQVILQQPLETRWQVVQLLFGVRDANPDVFDHARVLYEYEGYFDRINARLAHLRAEAGLAGQ